MKINCILQLIYCYLKALHFRRKGKVFLKKKVILCATVCALVLAMGVGCSQQSSSSQSDTNTSNVQSETGSHTQNTDVPVSSGQTESTTASDSKNVTATLYIGANGQFKEYPYTFSEDPTPALLIQAIADTTGWNLTLADITTSGKGGITVSFAKECALFTGPPEQQKDEFHMYDAEQLDRTILDSIQKTLQNNTIDSNLGDPTGLNVYYCMEGDKALELTDLNITFPMEQPYSSDMWDYLSREPGKG